MQLIRTKMFPGGDPGPTRQRAQSIRRAPVTPPFPANVPQQFGTRRAVTAKPGA